jgi:hypothetical protein
MPLIFLIITLLFIPVYSLACSCQIIPNFEESLREADLVFVGRVLELKTENTEDDDDTFIHFRPIRIFKGAHFKRIWIKTPTGEGACGIEPNLKERWLIWAYKTKDKQYATHICSRTLQASLFRCNQFYDFADFRRTIQQYWVIKKQYWRDRLRLRRIYP